MIRKSTGVPVAPLSPNQWRAMLANKLRWQRHLTPSEAWTTAWQVSDLKDLLRMGVVTFAYIKKKTGEERIARGTLRRGISAKFDAWMDNRQDTPQQIKKSGSSIPYWDLGEDAFRSFNPERLIDIKIDLGEPE